ncbi:SH3 domain-containing protein [Iningainema tapete]|uniref:SH3 domain-containing protein n=1 Tax=Iningainema tapete BLCC-T55 TaxID=2748662 RepID=A0A8J6XGC1_9CYAN|nr:SH3 domain-containing protein [Iningainema tapete]MBD2773708.1 SH3 domain-containing protein [Iningainema tapete BLCC-T55]
MKQKSGWQKYPSLTTTLVLTATVFVTPCLAVNTDQLQEIESSALETTWQKNQGEYQLAKYSSSCRRVMARNGLYVWRKPNNGSFVTRLDYGQQVTIRNRGKNGWVPISAPVRGYIFNTNYLASCQAAATPPNQNQCRRVVADSGLVVRRSPSINAVRVGVVPNARNVLIAKRGKNGWVSIAVPLIGYVQSKYLGYCSG